MPYAQTMTEMKSKIAIAAIAAISLGIAVVAFATIEREAAIAVITAVCCAWTVAVFGVACAPMRR